VEKYKTPVDAAIQLSAKGRTYIVKKIIGFPVPSWMLLTKLSLAGNN
jgi:hypothetical protein